MNPETPDADAAEQTRPAGYEIDEEALPEEPIGEADPADVLDQHRPVPFPDDDR